MMTIEEKYNLAMDIITKYGVEKDKEIIVNIADCIKNNRFLVEYNNGKIVLFISWADELIEGKRRVFLNNLWVEEGYRNPSTLTRLRKVGKYIFKNVDKFYWFNIKKQKLIER